jgi:hypothetical protein
MKPIARLMGVPYAPLTPTILPLPLPAKVQILFGEAMRFDGTGNEEDEVVVPMVHKVEQAVKQLVDRGLARRKGVFFG